MRICIACQSPGGLEGIATSPLEESEVLDYYDIRPDGRFEHVAQTRQCAGSCTDAVEGITRREVQAVIVAGLSPSALLKFRNAGIRVLKANGRSVRDQIKAFAEGGLEEITFDQFSRLARQNR